MKITADEIEAGKAPNGRAGTPPGCRMSAPEKSHLFQPLDVDVGRIRQLVEVGLDAAAIGRALNVSSKVIRARMADHGISRAPDSPAERATAPMPGNRRGEPIEPELAATGGRYGPLAAYAAAEGISLSHARMRWHQTGLPTQPTPGTTMRDKA